MNIELKRPSLPKSPSKKIFCSIFQDGIALWESILASRPAAPGSVLGVRNFFFPFQDSICSWISEPESVVNNWRGWRKNPTAANPVSLAAFQNGLVTGLASVAFNKRQQSEG